MTAPTWPKVVAAVEHNRGCRTRQTLGASHPHLAAYVLPCDCTRDARIGAGFAAVRESDSRCNADLRPAVSSEEWWAQIAAKDAAAVAAFREASKPKEEEG